MKHLQNNISVCKYIVENKKLLLSLTSLALLNACANLDIEDRQWQRPDVQKVDYTVQNFGWGTDLVNQDKNLRFYRATLEYKQKEVIKDKVYFGKRFNAEQYRNIEKWIKDQNKSIFLVTYVHGWHHNARTGDDNFIKFNDLLARVRDQLNRQDHGDMEVLGVYIGWQGEDSGSFFSIGNRGYAAEVIAQARPPDCLDETEVHYMSPDTLRNDLEKMAELVKKQSLKSKSIIIGHSLGGRVLSKMLIPEIMNNPVPIGLGKGSFVVTINAATGTRDFDYLYEKAPENSSPQIPYWINITSKDDWATRRLYPMANYVGLLKDGPYTIGHHDDYITHTLKVKEYKSFKCLTPNVKVWSVNPDTQCFIEKADGDLNPLQNLPRGKQANSALFTSEKNSNFWLTYPEAELGTSKDAKYLYKLGKDSDDKEKNNACGGHGTCLDIDAYRIEIKQHPDRSIFPVKGRVWNIQTDDTLIDFGEENDSHRSGKHNGFINTNLISMLVPWVLNAPDSSDEKMLTQSGSIK